MKISLAARKRTSAILMAVALATFTSVGPQVAEAQTAPEKIQLMASALRARDAGDLTLAKDKAEELIKIAPDDGNVQRLLASINKDLDRRAGSGVVFGQAADASIDAVMTAQAATPPAAQSFWRPAVKSTTAKAVAEPKMATPPAAQSFWRPAVKSTTAKAVAEPTMATPPAAQSAVKSTPANVQRQTAPSLRRHAPTVALSQRSASERIAAPSAADSIVAAAAADQDAKIAAAKNAIDEAEQLAELGAYADAAGLLNAASASLTLNTSTADVLDDLDDTKAAIVLTEAKALAATGDAKGAEALLEDYRAAGGRSRDANSLATNLDRQISNPYDLSIQDISPEYVAQNKIIRDLLTTGRAQYLNGDYDGAAATFKEVEARDANNSEAKLFQTRIAEVLGAIHAQNQYKTREQMLTEVDQSWERPKVFDIDKSTTAQAENTSGILQKMKGIVIPQVNFSGMELTRVIDTLSELSVEYDPEQVGVNIVPLFDANQSNPRVNISLRNLNLDRILEFVTQQVNFAYSVGNDAVTVDASDATGGESSNITEFFPISRATMIRLTGFRDGGGSSGGGPVDPFAAPSSSGSSAPSQNDEVEALQSFFQSAGVNFDVLGAGLAFDGEQLIVTQTSRNLERMRVILRNYNEVKQVEIESKFLEVQQGDLEELGFDWNVGEGRKTVFDTQNRSIIESFGSNAGQSSIDIARGTESVLVGQQVTGDTITSLFQTIPTEPITLPVLPPQISNVIDLAANAGNVLTGTGWTVNGTNVDLAIRALSRKTGSDLMSAPKVTVLSGKRATITVAQELRYPESYGDIESTVSSSSGGSSNSGGSAISITAGTPQDFVTRNVGVEMTVTPNVENDDTISLILEPRVTEFEGFVEYGGPSIALAGDTVATVPAGFYQPVFSVREITTEVTVYDGATVVMGGLTRDEVKTVNDKVPILGDIPGLGRLFRSEGESRQKRNLLIFVTANLVSPGGSPSRQSYRNVNANSLFQNPTIMTPSGAVNRSIDAVAE